MIPEALASTQKTLRWFKGKLETIAREIRTFANFPSLFMGLVTGTSGLAYYEGKLRFTDATGKIVADNLDPAKYPEFIGEAVEPYTYMKFPYYKPHGLSGGNLPCGPAGAAEYRRTLRYAAGRPGMGGIRSIERGAVLSSFHYHYARLIEILARDRTHPRAAQRSRYSEHPSARDGVAQQERRRGRGGSAARDADPPLSRERAGPDDLGQFDRSPQATTIWR